MPEGNFYLPVLDVPDEPKVKVKSKSGSGSRFSLPVIDIPEEKPKNKQDVATKILVDTHQRFAPGYDTVQKAQKSVDMADKILESNIQEPVKSQVFQNGLDSFLHQPIKQPDYTAQPDNTRPTQVKNPSGVDWIASKAVEGAASPVKDVIDTFEKAGQEIQNPNEQTALEGWTDAAKGIIGTAMLPFSTIFGAVMNPIAQSGKFGQQNVTNTNRLMNLPFDVVKGIGNLATKGLTSIGLDPAKVNKMAGISPELDQKLTDLTTNVIGLYAMGKGIKEISPEIKAKVDDVNKMYESSDFSRETSVEQKPVDSAKEISAEPTKAEIVQKPDAKLSARGDQSQIVSNQDLSTLLRKAKLPEEPLNTTIDNTPVSNVPSDPQSRILVNGIEKQLNEAKANGTPFNESVITEAIDSVKGKGETKRLEGLYTDALAHNKSLGKTVDLTPAETPSQSTKEISVQPTEAEIVQNTTPEPVKQTGQTPPISPLETQGEAPVTKPTEYMGEAIELPTLPTVEAEGGSIKDKSDIYADNKLSASLIPGASAIGKIAKRFWEDDLSKLVQKVGIDFPKALANGWNRIFTPELIKINTEGIDDKIKTLNGKIGKSNDVAKITDYKAQIADLNAQKTIMGKGGLLADAIISKSLMNIEQARQAIEQGSEQFANFFDKNLTPDEQWDFLTSSEEGKTFQDPKLNEYQAFMRDSYNKMYEAERAAGVINKRLDKKGQTENAPLPGLEDTVSPETNYRTNYLPHIFKDPVAAREYFGSLRKSLGQNKYDNIREIDLLKQAKAAGYELVTNNPEILRAMREIDSARVINYAQMMQELQKYGLATTEETPGLDSVTAPNGKQYYAPKTVAAIMNNAILSPSLWTDQGPAGMAFRGVMGIKNKMIPLKLGMSLFHPVHILGIDVATSVTRAQRAILDDPLSGKNWMHALNQLSGDLNQAQSWREGKNITDVWLGKKEGTDYDKQLMQFMQEGGYSPTMDEAWRSNSIKQMKEAWNRQNVVGVIVRAPFALVEAMAIPFMNKYVPYLKSASFAKEAQLLFERKPELLESENYPQKIIELRKIGKDMDNRYGELNYKTLFWDKLAKEIGVASSLSMGWRFGTIRSHGGSIIDLVNGIKNEHWRAENPQDMVTRRMLFTMNYVSAAALTGGLLTYALTGETPKDLLDLFFPRTGSKNPDGTDTRVSMPFQTKDIMSVTESIKRDGIGGGTMQYLTSGANPAITTMLEMLHNKDFYGYEISDPNANYLKQLGQNVKFMLDQSMPISFSGAKESGLTSKQGLLGVAGFNKAPGYVTQTASQKIIDNTFQNRFGQGTKPYAEKATDEITHKIRLMVSKGKEEDALNYARDQYKSGKITEDQGNKAMGGYTHTRYQYEFQRLPENDKKNLVLQVLQPKEYADYFTPESFANFVDKLPQNEYEAHKSEFQKIYDYLAKPEDKKTGRKKGD